MFEFKRSDWSITGNSGVTATVGTPVLKIQVGGSYMRLPVLESGQKKSNLLNGPGVGTTFGAALETPWTDIVNISGSFDFYPANGIGPIYRKARKVDQKYNIKNLTGDFLVLGGNGSANLHGMNLCLGIWLNNPMEQCLSNIKKCDLRATVSKEVLKIVPGGFPLAILNNAHAVGVFWGLVHTTDALSASVSAFQYRLSAAA